MIISVIITTYKEPKTLPKAIDSILSQVSKDKEMEIIVVGPDEQTKAVVQKFSSRLVLHNFPLIIEVLRVTVQGDLWTVPLHERYDSSLSRNGSYESRWVCLAL